MAKPKREEEEEEEEDHGEDEGRSDNLELISIGSLYSGPWDKKYWSSSRGKDRYPYPVGYQARRAYNGGAYKMEIREGAKGPLFVISSADGHSCLGQTPDIAWEKFQKNCFPRTKIWNGKRFSCKIDGIEFFGFKNPNVQRLLRELVANINEIAEQSSLSPSFCNEASRTEQNNKCPYTCVRPDSLSFLVVKGKRSKRQEIMNPKSLSTAGSKRSRTEDKIYIAEASNSAYANLRQAGGESSHSSAKDDFLLKVADCSGHLTKEAAFALEENRLAGSENCKSTTAVVNLYAEENLIDRSLDDRAERLNFRVLEEQKSRDEAIMKDSQCVHDVDLCAPDTFDIFQDTVMNLAPATQDKNTCSVKEKLIVTEAPISEGLVTEPHSEEGICTLNSSGSSERNDSDSVGQDIAKSMITVLLPQAIPLLKKISRKKKKNISCSENLPGIPKLCEKNDETGQFVEARSSSAYDSVFPGSENVKSVVPDSFDDDQCTDHVKPVVPDSFDDDQCKDHVTNPQILPANTAEAEQPCFHTNAYPSCRKEQFVNVDVKESSVFQVDPCGIKSNFCQDELQLAWSERPHDGYQYPSKAVLRCESANQNVSLEENKDACKTLDENSVGANVNSGFEDLKSADDLNDVVTRSNTCQRGSGASVQLSKKDSIKGETVEMDDLSAAQMPKKVYTRKKFSSAAFSTKKCDASSVESIIHRDLKDGSIPETTKGLCDSDTFQMSSDMDKPHKNNNVGAESMVGNQLIVFPIGKSAFSPNPLVESMSPFISHTQTFSHAPEGKDDSNLFVVPVSSVEELQYYSEDRLVEAQNTLDANNLVLSLEQGPAFFCDNSSSIEEVQTNSDLKLQWKLMLNNELDGIVELMGCYSHSMPVLSLLLVTKGDEICVCALCGSLADKKRIMFLYKLSSEGTRIGCPSIIGYTSVTFPSSEDIFDTELALEQSGLQLTPNGKHLVLLGNIKTPHCSEGRTDCLCATCTSSSFEQSSMNIVEVKAGYVSVLVNLKTIGSMQCILVCEPSHLIAGGKSGRLHLWTMNSAWSAPTEEYVISANDDISPCTTELKRIPNCASLVVGHNGFGEFTLWDISKRIYMSRFSSASASARQFFPICSFSWQREVCDFCHSNMDEHINRIIDATRSCFSENSEHHSFLPFEGEDPAIWLLVSTISESDNQQSSSSDCHINRVGWRLALLVKNMLVLGSALDPRATAIGSSFGNGIIGTLDGLVYMWELTTGTKLGTLHHFKGGSVSCIATDNSKLGVILVADDKGQLLVFRRCSREDRLPMNEIQ